MDPLLIVGAVLAGLVALFLIVTRTMKSRPHNARDDRSEPAELTGTEQYKRRQQR